MSPAWAQEPEFWAQEQLAGILARLPRCTSLRIGGFLEYCRGSEHMALPLLLASLGSPIPAQLRVLSLLGGAEGPEGLRVSQYTVEYGSTGCDCAGHCVRSTASVHRRAPAPAPFTRPPAPFTRCGPPFTACHHPPARPPARSVIAELTALRSLAMAARAIDMTTLPPGLTALTVIGFIDGGVVTRLADGGQITEADGEILPGECVQTDAEFEARRHLAPQLPPPARPCLLPNLLNFF